jgi:hypothetical protein
MSVSVADNNENDLCKRHGIRWAGHVARMGGLRNLYKISVGRPTRKWEDNIRMALREMGWEGVDWMRQV